MKDVREILFQCIMLDPSVSFSAIGFMNVMRLSGSATMTALPMPARIVRYRRARSLASLSTRFLRGNIEDRQQDLGSLIVGAREPPRGYLHCPRPSAGKSCSISKSSNSPSFFGSSLNIVKRAGIFHCPFPRSATFSDRLAGSDPERSAERVACRPNAEVAIQHHQLLPHGLADELIEGP
jgi:hypothetical protein